MKIENVPKRCRIYVKENFRVLEDKHTPWMKFEDLDDLSLTTESKAELFQILNKKYKWGYSKENNDGEYNVDIVIAYQEKGLIEYTSDILNNRHHFDKKRLIAELIAISLESKEAFVQLIAPYVKGKYGKYGSDIKQLAENAERARNSYITDHKNRKILREQFGEESKELRQYAAESYHFEPEYYNKMNAFLNNAFTEYKLMRDAYFVVENYKLSSKGIPLEPDRQIS